jgi:hypothetical protein
VGIEARCELPHQNAFNRAGSGSRKGVLRALIEAVETTAFYVFWKP